MYFQSVGFLRIPLHACFGGLQRLGQLVGAGGAFHAAGDALHTGDDIVDVHTLHELGNALQVAIAAAHELDVFDLVVFHIKVDHLRTGALGLILIHNKIPFYAY